MLVVYPIEDFDSFISLDDANKFIAKNRDILLSNYYGNED